ncbi:uncharacterized protein N7482_004187 [Penicillium canariense]|uniref:NmrA-like domain-containing protein n=1 Tax=Penicillium canariense TaxID=189055 RepID=A0A9W9LQB0_9EURO|nr:uncharacterized protein N7482_004187 [Penicillium canariense]KAJ5168593.1 hypothetical protein N7482_004187 [Penicillium canariense]
MSACNNVIIFGPTGSVGAAAALQAHREGAKITLAMRDTTKPIPSLSGISADKIEADLTKPETVKSAVRQSGAKIAFIYAIFGTSDHMRASIVALKQAGIETPVLLSSYSIQSDIYSVSPNDYVPWVHAQVEICLEEVFGKAGYVSVRPAYFASNTLWFQAGIQAGEVRHANPEAEYDWISPEDIGRVCGSILAQGPRQSTVWLLAPQRISLRAAIGLIGGTIGKEIKVTKIPAQEALAAFQQNGTPEEVAKWIVRYITKDAGYEFRSHVYEEAVATLLTYTQNTPVTLQQWLEENTHQFEA